MNILGASKDLKSQNRILCPGQFAIESDTGYIKVNYNKYEDVPYNSLKYLHELWPQSLGSGNGGNVDLSDYVTVNVFNTTINNLLQRIITLEGAITGAFDGTRDITSLPEIGDNFGTTTIAALLEAMYFQAEPLTVDIDGTYLASNFESSITIEVLADGANLGVTGTWSVGRQATSKPISTILIDGVNTPFSQPTQGLSVTGSTNFSIPRNINKTIEIVATDNGGDSVSANIKINFGWQRYWGYTNTPSADAFASQLPNVSKEFHTNIAKNQFSAIHPSVGNPKYFIIALKESFLDNGKEVVINIGGLDQTDTFDKVTQSLTNESGGEADYIFFISKNATTISYNNIVISEV